MKTPSWFYSRQSKVICAIPLFALVVFMITLHIKSAETPDSTSPTPTTNPDRPLVVALGDSFIAGEGAPAYLAGTNTGANVCHRANTAHPYLVARELDYRLVTAACSGAKVVDLLTDAQHPNSPSDQWGGLPQLDALRDPRISPDADDEPGPPAIVLVSIGGNDALFAEIVKTCIEENCVRHARAWLKNLDIAEERVRNAYRAIRLAAPRSTRVLVIPYPAPFVPVACIPKLTVPEMRFVLEDFLPDLNRRLTFQAEAHGLEVVDTSDVFTGARVCENGVRTKARAINVFTLSRPQGGGPITDLVRGSFHPTPLGHQLLALAVLDHLLHKPANTGPSCSENLSCPPTAPPNPWQPPPGETAPFPVGTRCLGSAVARHSITQLTEGQRTVLLTGAPDSRYCFADYKGAWRHGTLSSSGTASLPVASVATADVPSLDVLIQGTDGIWEHNQVVAPSHVFVGKTSMLESLRGRLTLLALVLVGLALLPWILDIIHRVKTRSPRLNEAQPR